ncbi:hypothetical protein N2152v2_006395 [Parachlorella kessleri]
MTAKAGVQVQSSAFGAAVQQVQNNVTTDIKNGLIDVCQKKITGSVASQATAFAFAQAVANATASVAIKIYTTQGGNACGDGNAWALSVANAIANATAGAFADVPCCPNAGANATAVANAVKAGCQSVIAKAYQNACASNGQTFDKTVTDIEYAVANATAAAFAQAFANIESCSEVAGCPQDNTNGTCTCPCPCAGACGGTNEGPAFANVTVTSTAFGQYLIDTENKTASEVKRLVDGVCAGQADTASATVTASAQAVAQAVSQAIASVAIDASTSQGGTACGQGNATALSVARAVARSASAAIAEAACCPNAAALAQGTANAIQEKCVSAIANATLGLCVSNGQSNSQVAKDQQQAIATAIAATFAQAITDIQSCSEEAGCPPNQPCQCPPLPTPPPCSAAPSPSPVVGASPSPVAGASPSPDPNM